jgi:hypothetical protein
MKPFFIHEFNAACHFCVRQIRRNEIEPLNHLIPGKEFK